MEVVGEEGIALDDMILYLKSELYEFCYLQQNAFDKEDAYCPIERQVKLFELVLKIFDGQFNFDTHDEARSFFLNLQNDIKNMNFLPFESHLYKEVYGEVERKLSSRIRA